MYEKFRGVYLLLFGPLETFEGDTIQLLLHFSTLLSRNKLQKYICVFAVVTICIYLLDFLFYAFFNIKEIMGFLTMQVTAFYFLVGYSLILTNSGIFLELTESFLKNSKPLITASDKVMATIKRESKIIVNFVIYYVVAVLIDAALFLPWTGDEDKIIFPVYRYKPYFGDNFLLEICPLFFHGAYAVSTPMFLIIYYMLHIKFQLALLIEKIEDLNLTDKKVSELVKYDINYQKKIKRRLVSCIRHHQQIKSFKTKLGETFYWPTFILASSVLVFETSLIAFYLNRICPSSNYRMIYTWCLTTMGHTIYAFVGQTIINESERLYTTIKCCNWYNWDKKNRHLLEMFLVHTQEPMIITSSGIVIVSNDLILKSYKVLYSLITFYQSMSRSFKEQ